MITPLLSATTIREICPEISIDISDKIINSACIFQQESLLKDTMTQDFYDDFYTNFINNTMSVEYTYLKTNFLDLILSYGVWKHLAITLSLQLNPAGLRVKTSDHSTQADTSDMDFQRNYIQEIIDSKRKSMYRYIQLHPTSYPLYFTDKYGDIPVVNDTQIITLSRTRGKNRMGFDHNGCPSWIKNKQV